jgi:hypothetical protein
MNTINVLIVVDAESALAEGSLKKSVYLIDTNHYLGSWREGMSSLHTIVQDGQEVSWWVTGVSSSNNVEIAGFSGHMPEQGICRPERQAGVGVPSWRGRVQTRGSVGAYTYEVTLTIDGRALSFSPYLKVI